MNQRKRLYKHTHKGYQNIEKARNQQHSTNGIIHNQQHNTNDIIQNQQSDE